jgi:hypothetical protein
MKLRSVSGERLVLTLSEITDPEQGHYQPDHEDNPCGGNDQAVT